MKGFRIISILLAILLLTVGCASENNDISELQLGIEALHNENVQEAKEHFEKASDEDQEQAKEYLEIVGSAESILASVQEDDVETAVDTYQEIEDNERFPHVAFIFAEEEETLSEVLDERKMIEEQLHALTAFFDPEDPEMTVNKWYILQSNKMLELEHITNEQKQRINELQEAVQKRIDERVKGNDVEQDSSEKEDRTEPETSTDQKDQEQEENESDVLSYEEARDAVYKYLYGEDAAGSDTPEDSNFKLEFDHDDGDKYVFHYYEVVQQEGEGGHTATLGWYAVDSKTGEVTDLME